MDVCWRASKRVREREQCSSSVSQLLGQLQSGETETDVRSHLLPARVQSQGTKLSSCIITRKSKIRQQTRRRLDK